MASLLLSPAFSTFVLPLLLTTFLILQSSPSRAQSLYQFCGASEGNYTANSTYQANLRSLLDSLSSNGSATGFASGTIGDIPDRIYGNVLCRGDATAPVCQTCITNAAQDVQQLCPFKKSAVIWYDSCLLQYSNLRFQAVDTVRKVYLWNTQNITSESSRFNESLVMLFDQMIRYAAYNTTAPQPRMFATGQMPFDRQHPTIYGLMQCTRDLSPDDCNLCLRNILGDLQNMNNREGGRVLVPACNFRFEVYPFYNGSSRLSLPAVGITTPPPSPAVSLPPPNGSTPSSSDSTRRKNSRKILASVIPLGIAAVIILIFCTWCIKKKGAVEYHRSPEEEIPSPESLFFDLPTIRSATDNFSPSNKLGEGGFGTVYKGILPNQQEIAAKRLSKSSGQGIEQLKNEVVLLAKLQHRNLVRLLGVCLEDEEKILIYEYVQNRSLDTFLFDPSKQDQLHWERRYKIIAGIARGLLYLHEESQVKIIHRDLKASNILLDASMNPKISDFGLARLFGGDQSEANTSRVVGTFGYMSPEYAMRGQFSNKSDVFSFGVIVLEILTGRKSNNFVNSGNSSDLLSYVWENWSRGMIIEILDPSLTRICPQNEALRCIQIGLLCVQENPADRPTMSSVILMLNSSTVSLQVPSRPPFFLSYSREGSIGGNTKTDTFNVSPTQFTTKTEIYSPNEMSVTDLDPR